eukprot:649813-Pyramimonas_sp.AAC.1
MFTPLTSPAGAQDLRSASTLHSKRTCLPPYRHLQVLKTLGRASGYDVDAIDYEAPAAVRAATIALFVASGGATAWFFSWVHSRPISRGGLEGV